MLSNREQALQGPARRDSSAASPDVESGRGYRVGSNRVDGAGGNVRAYKAVVVRDVEDGLQSLEDECLHEGVPLPVHHRRSWLDVTGDRPQQIIAVRDASGKLVFVLPLLAYASSALPGHRILRSTRFAGVPDEAALATGIGAATAAARGNSRVLSVHLEVLSPLAEVRTAIARVATRAGFRKQTPMRMYRRTVLLDLNRTTENVFAELHATARRHIRAIAKNPVTVGLIREPAYAGKMNELLRETMERTGGDFYHWDWRGVIGWCEQNPTGGRLVGLFDDRRPAPDNLLAFALALNHGPWAEYSTAASTRATDLRVPLAYGIAWELITWARDCGARWFDFAGVTEGNYGGDDPTGGISDFKRYFSKNVATVGDEWVFEPGGARPALARCVRVLHGLTKRFLRAGARDAGT